SSPRSTLVTWTVTPARAAGATLHGDPGPLVPVDSGRSVELERRPRAGKHGFGDGVLRHEAAGEFHPVVESQLVARQADGWQQTQDCKGGEGSHIALSLGGSVSGEVCRRIGAFHMYTNKGTSA